MGAYVNPALDVEDSVTIHSQTWDVTYEVTKNVLIPPNIPHMPSANTVVALTNTCNAAYPQNLTEFQQHM